MHLIFVGQGTHENYLTLNISQFMVVRQLSKIILHNMYIAR